MTEKFTFTIPLIGGGETQFEVSCGEILYILGPNGSGKSSLVHSVRQLYSSAIRIAAHRQNWFEYKTSSINLSELRFLEEQWRGRDVDFSARFQERESSLACIAISRIVNAIIISRERIADLARSGDVEEAQKEARKQTPIDSLNEIMKLSNIAVQFALDQNQNIVAQKGGDHSFNLAELSDGERNAFLIGASVLTAEPGTLIIIDEPERHLHRSIASPLLRFLFEKKKDCAFIVSTHELALPLDTPDAAALLLRQCEYSAPTAVAWAVDLLPPGSPISEELKHDILGARRKILFVEGKSRSQSLDAPLYALLFPDVSVIPKETCRNVEHAVKALRSTSDTHWISVWGIIDNDQRSPDEIARLREEGIWALSHYSVESLYFHEKILRRIAQRNAEFSGLNADTLIANAISKGINGAKESKEHLIERTVVRLARATMMQELPTSECLKQGVSLKVEIDIDSIRLGEEAQFDSLIRASDWNGLLARYPLRHSKAFDGVVSGLKIADKSTFYAAVLTMLQKEQAALDEARDLLGDLTTTIQNG